MLKKARLDRMRQVLAGHVASGRMPGLVALVHRRGETHVEALGTLAFGGREQRLQESLGAFSHGRERLFREPMPGICLSARIRFG
jgi:hypothetical protein